MMRTNTMRHRAVTPFMFALLAGVGLAGPALAQQPAREEAKPALRGPEVKDRNVPGVASDFGAPDGRRRFMERIPPEVYRGALGVLSAEDAPAEIKATPELQARIRDMVAGFENEVRTYRESHRQELADLRKVAGPAEREGRRGQGPPPPPNPNEMQAQADEMQTPEAKAEREKTEAARTKMRQIQEGAPKPDALFTRIWAELSEPQKKAVQAKLDEFKAEQAKRREEQYVRQRVGNKPADPGAKDGAPKDGKDREMTAAAPPGAPAPGGPDRPGLRISPERRERLMRFFSQLTPEEQDQLLERLEQRFRDGAPGRPGPEGRRPRAKPAPDPDKVKVPDAEGGK